MTGAATAEGTRRFAARFEAKLAGDFFRPLGGTGVRVSSIGLGSYLGECDDADDVRYAETAHHALASGINLLDTAINYRCQRSERALGTALVRAVRGETAMRDEVVVCSKGGYIPLEGAPPPDREAYREYVQREYLDRGIMTPADIVAGGHCMAPSYLADQIERSRANLSVATIDVYYLHNPEQQLDAVPPEQFAERLRLAFELFERQCEAGAIGSYGCATWSGLLTPPDAKGHLSLAALVATARELAGDAHHFRVVQLPVNLMRSDAARAPTQRLDDGRMVTMLEAASELGIAVIASASLGHAQLAADLPPQIREALPGYASDAQRAIAFVRSLPVISSALVGMKSLSHLRENLGAGRESRATRA